MRSLLVFLFFFLLVIACNSFNEKDNVKESIVFSAKPVKTQSLYAKPTLKAELENQQLQLTLELEKLTDEKLIINEVVLSNPGGLNSYPNNVQIKNLHLPNTQDTTLFLTFNHVNNKKLFHTTGLPGIIDSVYRVSVFFSLEGTEEVRTMNLDFKIADDTFLSYKKKYETPVQAYYFNTATGFEARQQEYLLKERVIKSSPFVHISDQEMAVSGLNYRVRCFFKKDSLHAEIFVVNHSDLTVRIDTTRINLIVDSLPETTTKQEININKVTGSMRDRDILRKGDRIICTLRTYIRDSPEKIRLTVGDSFFLANGKKLFTEDLELIPANGFLTRH